MPLNEQQQNAESINEQEFLNETQKDHSLASNVIRTSVDNDVWVKYLENKHINSQIVNY